MEIYDKGDYERLIYALQEHHLEMNEYKKYVDEVPIADYLYLLDNFIECAKRDRDSLKWREEVISRYEIVCNKYKDLLFKR